MCDATAMKDEPTSETADESAPSHTTDVRKNLEGALGSTTQFLRDNPWVGVAGGLLLGAALITLAKPAKPEPTNLEKLRDMLDDVYAKLPTKKEAKSAMSCLLNKLHLPV